MGEGISKSSAQYSTIGINKQPDCSEMVNNTEVLAKQFVKENIKTRNERNFCLSLKVNYFLDFA